MRRQRQLGDRHGKTEAEIGFRLSEAKEGWDHQPLGEARTDPFPEASEGAWPC